MEENQNIPTTSDFSGIPSLGDAQGLENYLNNEALKAQGLPVQQPTQPAAAAQPAPAANPTPAPAVNPAPAATPATQPAPGVTPNPAQPAGDSVTITREQYNALLAGRAPAQPQPQQQTPKVNAGYTPQEQTFIMQALSQGYSLEQINNFLATRKTQSGINPVVENRIKAVEDYLRAQEQKTAETAFINKMVDFGNKWGLSEQDLVTFGQEALKQGINIAQVSNLETVFRAVYPEQYAIRSQRMTPTNSSQIYGGTSIPEGNRASAAKLEDAYVDNFLKNTMPNQYGMLKK